MNKTITGISELNVGDEILITVRTKVIHKGEAFKTEPPFVNTSFTYEDGTCIGLSDVEVSSEDMTVVRVSKALPDANGIYVPANNADYPEGSFIYVRDEQIDEGPWVVYTGKTIYRGDEALTKAENAHNNLGSLIPLTVKGA